MASQAPRQIKTIVGLNLRAARKAKQLTQRDLAQLLDTDAFQVSRWERGVVRPGDATLVRLGEALGMDYASFFTEPQREAA